MTLIFVTAKTTNNKPSHDIYSKEWGGFTSSDSQLHRIPVLLVALQVNNWAGGVIPVERWRGYDLVYNLRLVPWTFKTALLSVAYSWLHYVFCSRKLLDVWKATCCPCHISRPTRNTLVANCVCFHKIRHSVKTRKVCPVYWRNCFETAICGTFSLSHLSSSSPTQHFIVVATIMKRTSPWRNWPMTVRQARDWPKTWPMEARKALCLYQPPSPYKRTVLVIGMVLVS